MAAAKINRGCCPVRSQEGPVSVRIMASVWELELPQNEKLVLLALADHSDDRGSCYPSVARLAWKSGYSVRQTQTILKNLRVSGILDVIGSSAGGRGNATQYQIHSEKGAACRA
jgi:Helix-turn-helix domain